ncbi:hypothetical protein ABZ725_42460 [Streptomyces sp. NPDC006872]|uniref:hypothetical protein n=1 Tax=Streptomyces sp. NPDC006872 TaxID=3155720 RepID=UPI0033E1747A
MTDTEGEDPAGLPDQGVVVPSRSQSRLDALTKLIGPELGSNLKTIAAGYGAFDEADELATLIVEEHSRVDHVVASAGGWWMGKALWRLPSRFHVRAAVLFPGWVREWFVLV